MTSDIRGVLFDKDGTLFNFNATWSVFCDRMLVKLGGNDEALKSALADSVGYDRSGNCFRVGSLIVNASAAEVNVAWSDLCSQFSLQDIEALTRLEMKNLPAFPVCDLTELMGQLRAVGLNVGVATNDYEMGAKLQLDQVRALDAFDFICGSDSGYGRKPDPGMINAFCEKMGLQPRQIAFVGDSTHDLLCGKNAGAGLCVGVLTGPASKADLDATASIVLNSIAELPQYLSSYTADAV